MKATIITNNTITIHFDEGPLTIDSTHMNFSKVRQLLKKPYPDFDTLYDLMNVSRHIQVFSMHNIVVQNGVLYYKGKELHNVVVDRIFEFIKNGYPAEPLLAFLDNLMQNPSNQSVNELYLFLEAAKMPITDDGCFLAFKKVRLDYKDCHSGRYDNSVGSKVSMPRNEVDDRREVTCSYGFHVASFNYAKNFQSGRMMVTKVNPRDVVSVPKDYNNEKMRVTGYEVVDELRGHSDFLTNSHYYNY